MNKCSCGCDLDIVKKCDNCNFNEGRKQGAVEELKKSLKDLNRAMQLGYDELSIKALTLVMEKRLKELKGVN
jgi:hypothetical protein